MSNPINQIFNEPAIKTQVSAVLAALTQVGEAMKNVQKAADGIKIGRNDVQNARNAAALERANNQLAESKNKLRISEEKLAMAIAKRAAAEANAARATGQQVNNISEIDRLTRLYEEGLKRLNGTLSTEAEKLAQVRVANAEVSKQLKQQAREVLGLSGAYDKLQQEFNQAKVAAQNLGAQLGVNSNEYKAAAAAALALNNQLKAIDAGVGGFQRNVGNYASGFQNFTQVLREMPNFAISATVGVQSLSNNIPMLVAELQAARAAGASWGAVMMGLGKQLLGFQTIAILAVTALTMLPSILREMGAEAKKAEDEMRSFFEGITRETTSLKTLFDVAKDVNQSMEVRKNAVKELRDQYGNYLQNLTDEQILAGNTANKYNELSEAILKSARARAASDQITKLQAQKLINEQKMADADLAAQERIAALPKKTTMASAGVGGAGQVVTAEQMAAGILSNLRLTNAGLQAENDKLDKQMERLSKTVMENQVKPFKTGEESGGGSTKKYFDEKYQLMISDLERQNVYLKAIADSDKYSYEVRMEALKRFSENERKINEAQRDDSLAKNAFELKNDKNATDEKRSINAKFRLDEAKAEVDFLKSVESLTDEHLKNIADKKKKDEEERVKANEAYVDNLEKDLAQIALDNEKAKNKALIEAGEKFLDGRIKTVEEYEKEKAAIELKYLEESIKNQIAFLEFLLYNANLDKDLRAKFEQEIINLKLKGIEAVAAARKKDLQEEEKDGKKRKKTQEEKLRDLQKFLTELDQGVRFITQSINEIAGIGFANTQARLEEERTAIEKNAKLELERINNSTLSEQQKADQVIILEAKKQAQLEENDRKRRKLDQEKARFDRLNSIAGIISGTALAVVKALPNVVLATLVGVLGAAQLAAAIAAPIPKYKFGTSYHKGGLAVVGDGGKSERVILPSGEQFDTPNKSTLVNLPKGSKVLPDAALASKLMLNNMPRRVQAKADNANAALTIWQTRELTKAMAKNKPRVNTKVNVNLGRDLYLYKNVFE